MPDARCPYCGAILNAASDVKAQSSPEPGSWTVCAYCLGIAVYRDDFMLRTLADGEWASAPAAMRAEVQRVTAVLARARGEEGRRPS